MAAKHKADARKRKKRKRALAKEDREAETTTAVDGLEIIEPPEEEPYARPRPKKAAAASERPKGSRPTRSNTSNDDLYRTLRHSMTTDKSGVVWGSFTDYLSAGQDMANAVLQPSPGSDSDSTSEHYKASTSQQQGPQSEEQSSTAQESEPEAAPKRRRLIRRSSRP